MGEDVVYRVWFELHPPLLPAYWWLVERGLTVPNKRTWLGRAEDGVRALAEKQGWTLIGDPIGDTEKRDGRVVVRASGFASGPLDATAPTENGPRGIDG